MSMTLIRLGVSEPADIATARQMFEMVSGIVQPFDAREPGVVKAVVPEDKEETLRLNVLMVNEQACENVLEWLG